MSTNEREEIIQNLKACDCDDTLIDRFMASLDAGRVKEALRMLDAHRRDLLDRFHKCNDNIGCLDYLAHQIENKNTVESTR